MDTNNVRQVLKNMDGPSWVILCSSILLAIGIAWQTWRSNTSADKSDSKITKLLDVQTNPNPAVNEAIEARKDLLLQASDNLQRSETTLDERFELAKEQLQRQAELEQTQMDSLPAKIAKLRKHGEPLQALIVAEFDAACKELVEGGLVRVKRDSETPVVTQQKTVPNRDILWRNFYRLRYLELKFGSSEQLAIPFEPAAYSRGATGVGGFYPQLRFDVDGIKFDATGVKKDSKTISLNEQADRDEVIKFVREQIEQVVNRAVLALAEAQSKNQPANW